MTDHTLLPCPFCGGEAELLKGAPGLYSAENHLYHAKCQSCGASAYDHGRDGAIAAWNRRTAPAAGPEPWGWLCNGKGDGWEEKDKIVRDPELVAEYMAKPEKWTVQPLYLSPRTELTESDLDLATYIARTIAISMAKNYPEASQWQPADNLIGLLYQISNMSTGLSRAAPTPDVPEGWVLLPREPTDGMIDKGESALVTGPAETELQDAPSATWAAAKACYRAMISAAPAAPTDE